MCTAIPCGTVACPPDFSGNEKRCVCLKDFASHDYRNADVKEDAVIQLAEGKAALSQLVWPVLFLGIANIFVETLLGSAIVPILPRALRLDTFYQGIVLSCGAIAASVLGPLSGWLCDAKGWFWSLIWFYPLSIISAFLLFESGSTFNVYVIARLIGGIGSGFMYPSNLSMVSDSHPQSVRATAVGFTLAGDVGSLCGPIFGGVLYDFGGPRLLFGILSAVAMLNFLVFLVTVGWRSGLVQNRVPLYLASEPSTRDDCRALKTVGAAIITASSLPLTSKTSLPNLTDGATCPKPSSSAPLCTRLSTASISSSSALSPPPALFNSTRSCPSLPITGPDSAQPIASHSLPASTETYVAMGDAVIVCPSEHQGFWSRTRSEIRFFLTLSFMARFLSLFYTWGCAVSAQAILPYLWDYHLHLSPTSIGILFAPHLIFRVVLCAFSAYLSDLSGIPLSHFISGGVFCATAGMVLLALLPSRPIADALCLGLVGAGVGICDSCGMAWAGAFGASVASTITEAKEVSTYEVHVTTHQCSLTPIHAFEQSLSHKCSDHSMEDCTRGETPAIPCSQHHPDSPITRNSQSALLPDLRGRAFALMALACDLGMFTVPLIASAIAQLVSPQCAFALLGATGSLIVYYSLYSPSVLAISLGGTVCHVVFNTHSTHLSVNQHRPSYDVVHSLFYLALHPMGQSSGWPTYSVQVRRWFLSLGTLAYSILQRPSTPLPFCRRCS